MAASDQQSMDFSLFQPGSKSYTAFSAESNKAVADVLKRTIDGFNAKVCTADVSLKDIADRFKQVSLPDSGVSEEDVVKYFQSLEQDAIKDELHLQSPHMIGHMTGATLPWTGAVAQILSLLNLNVVKAETAKCGTFVERETVGMVHKLFWQKPDEWYADHIQASRDCLGHVTSGGTVANIEALWCARNTALPGVEALGLHGAIKEQGYDDAVIICSRLAHYSVSKACGILGLGTQQMVSIPVNTKMQVDIDLMREALEDCKKKNKKVLAVIALAGSTECGSFDDLTAVAGLCKEHNVWMHVDAAWGGGLVFSPTAQQTLFKGVHHADSVTIDAHKQLFTPMGFGMVMYRDENIAQNITKTAQYIIRADSSDLGRFTMEGSRPAIAHYLRANLFILGKDGMAATMDNKMGVAKHLAQWLKAQPDFDLLFDPQADILLTRYVPQHAAFKAMSQEEQDQFVDELTQRVQTMQSKLGRTFTSRTAVFDPRNKARLESQTRTHFYRIVVNAQITPEDAVRILKDTRYVAEMLLQEAKPVAEAQTLTQAFAHVALNDPTGVAVECNGSSLTFKELFERASALTCKITCAPGSVVPIMAEQGVNSFIAVLAVLLRGCAWLVVDTSMSAEDVAKTLQAAQATDVLLTAKQLTLLTEAKKHLDASQSAALRALTVANTEPLSAAACAPPAANSDSLAQMILESGKSMKFTHRQLLDMFDETSIKSAFERLLAPAGTLSGASEIAIKKAMEAPLQGGAQQAC